MSETDARVVMVLEGTFPRLGGGGAESQVLTLARCLVRNGTSVVVVAPRVKDGPQALREWLLGFEIVRIPYPAMRWIGGVVMLVRLFAYLVRSRDHYAVIHAHIGHNMAAVAVLAGRLLAKPVFVKITGLHEMRGGILDGAAPWISRVRRAIIRRADAIQATSSRIAQLLVERRFDAARVVLIPNGVDMSRFPSSAAHPALRRSLSGEARRVGVFVGRLSAEKGLGELLAAWARAFPGATDVKLLLVGEGPLRSQLAALASDLGIDSHVAFAGHRSDVAEILSTADFAILPSTAEGLSNALLEYMAAGLPVVGSRVSGTEDFVVDGKTGWLFESSDGEALARCLRTAGEATPSNLARMGRAARERVSSLASVEAVTERLQRMYAFAADLNGSRAPGG